MLNNFFAALEKMRSSFWQRVVLQAVLMFAVTFFVLALKPLSTELMAGPELTESQHGAATMVVWMSFILLYRTLFYDRLAFGVGLVAGGLWLFSGDLLVAPFWMGLMGLLVHLYKTGRAFSPVLAWYLFIAFIAILAYNSLYLSVTHPLYVVLFVVLFVGYCLYDYRQKAVARKRQAMDAILAEAEKEKQRVAAQGETYDIELARLEKLRDLPGPVKSELNNILTAAQHIRHSMLTDPRDEPAGRQFLERYLPIVYTIVTKGKHVALQQDQPDDPQLNVLRQLSSAFYQKHQQLQENDRDDLNIEISTLEKLLKTDGFTK